MAIHNPYQKYQQNSVMSASPEELTQMLYSGGVRFIRQGIECIENKEVENAHKAIVKAQEIYTHLADTLNNEIELAKQLSSLYDFMLRQLMQANSQKDAALLMEVLALAEELRDTWQEAMQHARRQAQAG
ncbi:MAG TPA: flagellar export chaperone FliS [Desulfotomaculum sp.]|nr:MAG: flagellar biosynthesis protein FliS [Desulfotomaculum sp. BICA1-6]HBX23712.1 flagellar export chaperone FliS [Desulfotomaculum sp.]